MQVYFDGIEKCLPELIMILNMNLKCTFGRINFDSLSFRVIAYVLLLPLYIQIAHQHIEPVFQNIAEVFFGKNIHDLDIITLQGFDY